VSSLVPPLPGLVYETVPSIDADPDYTEAGARALTTDISKATVITSRVDGDPDRHKVVLDLDLPAKLLPSSTEGHFHLYVDKAIPWTAYTALLEALATAGLVEDGYVSASLARGHTAARLPWIRKPAAEPSA
jgi:hypothetical protein